MIELNQGSYKVPLVQGKSKKAFSENVSREMHAGKPQDQSLAIAYSVKRKNAKKKMAYGGKVTPEEIRANEMERAGEEREMKPMERVQREGRRPSPPESEYMANHFEQGGAVEHTPSTHIPLDANERIELEALRKLQAEHERDMAHMAEGGMLNPDAVDHNPYVRRGFIEKNAYAEGGNVDLEQSRMEPHDEDPAYMAEDSSMAAEIMRNRKQKMYAEGGQVDLEKNSEEDLNNEDQMSYKAGMKEQYDLRQLSKQPEDSNEESDEEEKDAEDDNDEDTVSAIRKKMKSKRI